MENDAYITRRQYWWDDDKVKRISEEEWSKIAGSDPEMRWLGRDFAKPCGCDSCRNQPRPISIWFWSETKRFDWEEDSGTIRAYTPDKETRVKMYNLALKLGDGAKIQGEDMETYDAEGNEIPGTRVDGSDMREPPKNMGKPRYLLTDTESRALFWDIFDPRCMLLGLLLGLCFIAVRHYLWR